MLLGGEVAWQGEEDCSHTAFNCAARDITEELFSSGLYPLKYNLPWVTISTCAVFRLAFVQSSGPLDTI